jgi:predicted flap endonuclease-1-like 5' DNA nuclease
MNLLFRILYAQKCTSTHHCLAMDALRYLRVPQADRWCRLMLAEVEQYIDGSKAPDKKFRDFRNHVLHVADNYWGGAVPAAELWYGRLVDCLHREEWRRAVYCAGVLTHYITDPFMPLLTGQTEDEGAVHKLIEWGTAEVYRDLVATLPAARGIHNWKPPADADSSDWLALLIIEGATLAHQSYDIMIDHYDPVRGAREPSRGMDTECCEAIAHLLGRCIRAIAWVLDRAFIEAAVCPPDRSVSLATLLTGLSTPVFFMTRRMSSRRDRAAVRAIVQELNETGRVIESLPPDDREIRSAHAAEVLRICEKGLRRQRVRRPGTQFRIASPEEQREKRFRKHRQKHRARVTSRPIPRLRAHDDVIDAPSIGPKTAGRLRSVGIRTISDLLQANPSEAEVALQQRWMTGDVVRTWQLEAALVCTIPNVRGVDAQLLVGIGISAVAELHAADVPVVFQLINEYAATSQGRRIVRSSSLPSQQRIAEWIQSAETPIRRAA